MSWQIGPFVREDAHNPVLGIGERYHAVPWSMLDYEKSHGGYVVPFTKEQIEAAPAHSIEELSGADGQKARDSAFDYYKVDPYWN